MRMAFLSVHSSPLGRAGSKDTGGMSTYLRGLSRALGEMGHQIDLFTRAAAAGEEGVWEISPGVRLIAFEDGLGPLDKYELYPHCSHMAAVIDRFCGEGKAAYSLIISHYWLSGVVGRVLQEKWKIPHLIMFHTLGRAKNKACRDENEPRLRLEQEEALARSCDRIIVASRQEKENLLRFYNLPPDKIVHIPGGIDRTLFKPLERSQSKTAIGLDGKKIILSVGRIEPIKGFDLLISAAALLPGEDDFRLVIVGGDDQSSERIARLKEGAAEQGLAGKVIFPGLVEHERMPLYYSAADVTVLASHYESIGLVALESIACGTPVAAGSVGVIPELLDNRAAGYPAPVYVPADRSPAAWAAAIRQALLRPGPLGAGEIESCLAPFNWPPVAAELARQLLI